MAKSRYRQALERPTRPGGMGWKYADQESSQAATAQLFGGICGLSPQGIFDWAMKHDVHLMRDISKSDQLPNGALLIAVLNDVPITWARADLDKPNREPQ